MSKNSIDVYGASGKSNVLTFDPNVLVLVTDPTHVLYDARVHLPVDEKMVRSIIFRGVVQPIVFWKDPETGETLVVAGRQRVKAAREANRRLLERGEMPVQVPGVVRKVKDHAELYDVMVIENEIREADTPLGRAEKMRQALERGRSLEQIGIIFGCKESTVNSTLALLDSPAVVREAVEAGAIGLTHVKALSKLAPDEQRAKVAELIAAGDGARPHERAKKQRAVLGNEQPKMKTRAQITKALQTATGEGAAALRWVLGIEQHAEALPGLDDAVAAMREFEATAA